MFLDILLFIGLVFSLYGLSCAIASLVIWLSVEDHGNNLTLLVPVYEKETSKTKITFIVNKLKNSGISFVTVVVVGNDLSLEKEKAMQSFCEKKQLSFCKKDELDEYLLKSSFQNEGNTV